MKEKPTPRFPWYGWVGLFIVAGAELCLALRQPLVSQWFTPIVWTGYILFADALAFRLRGHSLIRSRPREALMMAWISAGCWAIFEAYNMSLWNWYYVGVPEEVGLRTLAYVWAFATIFPGIFETMDVLDGLGLFRRARVTPRKMSPLVSGLSFLVGVAFLTIPPLLPEAVRPFTFAFIWLGFIFFLEPVNRALGVPSCYRAWEEGNPRPTLLLLTAGGICGLLWEFWNYWATGGWRYTIPWPLDFGVYYFRMPILGMLGFPPFAMECYAMYHFVRRMLGGESLGF
ncbi:MAG: hypothetical protein RMK65_01355 [Anaerolineae bacterium]|nr:hypothetical protein [Anaerolineae bacterium]MCX8067847.1 hypothetical protein [Anaerolineae bacterium]MDW7990793.1 hypothetical protein [Anaerolineae bacterium]